MLAIIIGIELVLMIWLRKGFAQQWIRLVMNWGGSQAAGVWWYAILSLPGVLSHEIAHFLMAALLGLRTGAIELLPKLNSAGGVEFGSVQVEAKDPIRLSLVGLAPMILGLPLVAWLSILFRGALETSNVLTVIGFGYLLATITIHLLPSRQDMATWPVTAIILGLLWLLLLEINKLVEIKWDKLLLVANPDLFRLMAESLLIPIGGLIVGAGGLWLINRVLNRRRIV